MSGIFRDVYILKRPERAVCDYRITTEVSKEVARIKLDIRFYQPIHLNIRVEDKNGAVVSQGTIEKDGIIEFEIFCPVFWNTENPYLYTVILESKYEVIVDAVALRTIEIYDKVCLLYTSWPGHITFEAYSKLFTTTVNFFAAMKNSFIVASLTTIVSLTASTLAAYAFSRYQFTGRKILMCTFLCNNMFPTVLLLIPLYTIMRKMGLLYTPASLVLSYTTFTIPLSLIHI